MELTNCAVWFYVWFYALNSRMMIKCATSLCGDIPFLLYNHLRSACTSIQIICFEVSSRKIINQLIQKGNEGVAVQIICEERKAGRELFNWAEKGVENVDIKFSNPNDYYYALHEKLILIDDSIAIFGSFNLSDKSLNDNIEILFETTEPGLIQKIKNQISFIEQVVNNNQGQPTKNLTNIIKAKSAAFLSIKKENNHLLFSDEYSLHHIIFDFLSKAKSSITVFASHHISHELLDLLFHKSTCNVKVNVVIDYSVLNRVVFLMKNTALFQYVAVEGKMHIKAILVDDNTYLVGSVNLFERSLFQDQEFLLVGNDPALNKIIRDHLSTVAKISKPLSLNLLWLLKLKHYKSRIKMLLKKTLNVLLQR